MICKRFCTVAAFTTLISICGCAKNYFGTYPNGLDKFPQRSVSASEAVKNATPFLDQCYRLRQKSRNETESESEAAIYVTLKGKYYHVVKDDYVSMNAGYYLTPAVKVHSETGKIIVPE